ncbi:MAG: 3-deoxy-D-manno-octulosonic acid transferase [Proteobacteria bacterium]|nr:3-deoxy-D-manno-octulosonic acid transferase [Pseudomonadota bacterium]
MFVLYNILQLAFLLVFSPLITLFVACSSKYRDRVPARLSAGIAQKLSTCKSTARTIWVHALSVGEVTSAVPLVRGLRAKYPGDRIVVSVTTRSGKKVAETLLSSSADCIIDGPLDLLPVVQRFINHIHPNLFILVETDFWPNILLCLKKKEIPTILVNGRVSEKSMTRYQRLRFFFLPMFQCFSFLSMQTLRDKEKMEFLGISQGMLPILGNLKFATRPQQGNTDSPSFLADLLPKDRILFIAGSTHPGEELILIDVYVGLRDNHPELFLIIAPRDPRRAKEIADLAAGYNLQTSLRSHGVFLASDIFVLDSIGELVDFYALADLAFVGGSLVEKGGHNPIEPAAMSIPVLFGPHMEDFSEIADSLVSACGAVKIDSKQEISKVLSGLLNDSDRRSQMGLAAQKCVLERHDIIAKHLDLIAKFL